MRAMRKSARWFQVGAYAVGFIACGTVRPGNAPTDGQSTDAAPPRFLSCAGLATTCGAGGNDSCCNSLAIPGGSFDRSYDLAGDGNSGTTSFPATVGGFALDKYEVTVGRFRAFVNAGVGTQANPPVANAGAHPGMDGSGWNASWNANLPANTDALIALLRCDSAQSTWTEAPAANEIGRAHV